jgi:hypothetical protein
LVFVCFDQEGEKLVKIRQKMDEVTIKHDGEQRLEMNE